MSAVSGVSASCSLEFACFASTAATSTTVMSAAGLFLRSQEHAV
jgi:hypothetical protein